MEEISYKPKKKNTYRCGKTRKTNREYTNNLRQTFASFSF